MSINGSLSFLFKYFVLNLGIGIFKNIKRVLVVSRFNSLNINNICAILCGFCHVYYSKKPYLNNTNRQEGIVTSSYSKNFA